MFDYKKLDQYKVALDDGAVFEYEYDLTYYSVRKVRNFYYFKCKDQIEDKWLTGFDASDFEVFKKRVEEFYEGGSNGR